MSLTAVKRSLRLSQWGSIIQACQSSGQSVSSWCEEHDIKPYTYYYWLRIIRQESLDSLKDENSILKIPDSCLPMKTEAPLLANKIIIRHYQTSIELPFDYDVHKLAILVKGLSE